MLPQHFWSWRVAALRPPGATFSLLFRQGDGFHGNTFRKNPSGFVLRSYTSPHRWRHSHQGKKEAQEDVQKAVPAAPKRQTPSPSVKRNVPPIPEGASSWQPPLSPLSPLSSPPFPSLPSFPHTFLRTRRRLNCLLGAVDGADASQRYACAYLRVFEI